LIAAMTGFGERSELAPIELDLPAHVVLAHALPLFQVGTSAERLVTRTRDHDGANGCVRGALLREPPEREERVA
jgi:hypothetical protein